MAKDFTIMDSKNIQSKIYTIHGHQVMFDKDLAELYGVETKQLKRAVKRNLSRFPNNFMFEITENEYDVLKNLRCQFGTSSWGGSRYPPYVFTEQGVAMLASVLKSKMAIEVSIAIINTFIEIRRYHASNSIVHQRFNILEHKIIQNRIETDKRIDKVFKAIETEGLKPKQGVFFEGQIFDAYVFISNLIKKAEKSIILIDNYVDSTVLLTLTNRKKGCKAIIYTMKISKKLEQDLEKHNSQYPEIEIKELKNSHDRFLILDEEEIYHIGASIKDLGKKWFAFSKLEKVNIKIMERLKN